MEQETNVIPVENTLPENKPEVQNAEPESIEQINWKKFREVRKAEREEAETAKRKAAEKEAEATALKAAMEAILTKPQSTPRSSVDEEIEESEEVRIQKIVDQKIAERERRYEEDRLKREKEEALPKAMKTFPDFKEVYTQENCDWLEYHHPHLFESLRREADSFDKWSRVYHAMKQYIPNPSNKKDNAKIDKNLNKPQSMSVGGMTSTGDTPPVQLTEQRRQDNWNRMMKVMKGVK